MTRGKKGVSFTFPLFFLWVPRRAPGAKEKERRKMERELMLNEAWGFLPPLLVFSTTSFSQTLSFSHYAPLRRWRQGGKKNNNKAVLMEL